VAVALALIAQQPYRGPWWRYADADATYTASALDLEAGEHTRYLDHPGLPLQETLAGAFAIWHWLDRLTGETASSRAFAGSMMLHLGRARPLFRGLAAATYLLSAALAALLVGRWLGRPLWGLAGGLLWLSAPGLPAMSIQYRPDVLLAGLIIPIGYLTMRGYERRAGAYYLAAAALVGFAITVKLHAAGMLVPLVLALALRPPTDGVGAALGAIRRTLLRHRMLVAIAVAVWVGAVVYFDASQLPFTPTSNETTPVAEFLLVVGVYALVAFVAHEREAPGPVRRLFDPFVAAAALALAVGLAIPAVVVLDDGLTALADVTDGLRGGGINSGVTPFTDWSTLLHYPLLGPLIVFAAGGVAAVVGCARRDARPLIWFAGALTLQVMAVERYGHLHYFAPGYVAAIPAALWLPRHFARLAVPLATALVALALVPVLRDEYSNPPTPDPIVGPTATALAASGKLVDPGEVVVTPTWLAIPDVLYYDFVQSYVIWTPDYPYRFLPKVAGELARARHLRPRYAVLEGADGSLSFGDTQYTTRPVSNPLTAAVALVRLSAR
jgi:hypothetical protein